MKNLRQRTIVSLLLTALVTFMVTFAFHPIFHIVFVALVAAMGAVACWEYFQLATACTFRPLQWVGVGGVAAYIIATALATGSEALAFLPSLALAVTVVVAFVMVFAHGIQPLGNLAVTIFGVVYLGLALSCLLPISQHGGDGRLWLAYLLVVTKVTDMAAYVCGQKWGRRPLAPEVSPNKTVEGALGGLAAATTASLLFSLLVKITIIEALVLGITIGIVAQVGDLAESLLKRDAGVKHSNRLPGLGGILDILDSVLFTAPLLYLFLQWHEAGVWA